jgi:hypothetical protein
MMLSQFFAGLFVFFFGFLFGIFYVKVINKRWMQATQKSIEEWTNDMVRNQSMLMGQQIVLFKQTIAMELIEAHKKLFDPARQESEDEDDGGDPDPEGGDDNNGDKGGFLN